MRSISDGANTFRINPILPRAVITTSRSRRCIAVTMRRAQSPTLITSPSFTGLTRMGLPSGPVAFSRIPVATNPG